MKKVILFTLLAVGCTEIRTKEVIDFTEYKASSTDTITPYRPEYAKYADRFMFDGHRYIGFNRHGRESCNEVNIVHDPDCPCKNKGEE